VWIDLSTQFGPAVSAQANTLSHAGLPPPKVAASQLEAIVRSSCLGGVRGFLFQSASSLSERDPIATTRSAELELINRRLQLMEPWLAGGKVAAQVTSTTGDVTAAVMYVDRARLLVPLERTNAKPANQANLTSPTTTFIVPGVSESSQVYFLTPVSFRSLSSQRIAGGTRIEVPALDNAFLVITEDPQVVQSLRQHVVRHATKTLRLERDLAVERARSIFRIEQQLAQSGVKPTLTAADATNVNTQLAQLDALLASQQLETVHQSISAVNAELERLQSVQQAPFSPAGLASNALALSHERLRELAALDKSFEALRGSENLLPAGDFENLNEMTRYGWQHVVSQRASAATHVQLATLEPRHGSYSLELAAMAPPGAAPDSVTDPLVWIVSPGMPLEAGKLVEISGWVRVDQPFAAGAGGLAIVDTLGGPELSLVVRETSGWQSFRMIRAVPTASELRLTFALNAYGSAKVDAVMVRTLDEPIARRLPSIGGESSATSTAEAGGSVIAVPQTR
jgi:hypothetical protein